MFSVIDDVNIRLVLLGEYDIPAKFITASSVGPSNCKFSRIHMLHGCQQLSTFTGVSQHKDKGQP